MPIWLCAAIIGVALLVGVAVGMLISWWLGYMERQGTWSVEDALDDTDSAGA